jgi:hypothetical protein
LAQAVKRLAACGDRDTAGAIGYDAQMSSTAAQTTAYWMLGIAGGVVAFFWIVGIAVAFYEKKKGMLDRHLD